MANMVDYLLWRGDLEINNENPFNQIDSMILARFSYLIFEKIELKTVETISTIAEKMLDFDNTEFKYNGDKALITNLGISKRFKNMLVTDYIQKSDLLTEKQFSAITIHISKTEMYISYEGTDKTINGWKEDFNLAFMENVPAQIEGKKYAENIMEKYPKKLVRIGGHSKGGNIAIYTAISLSDTLQDRIIKVDNFDGPGFGKGTIKKYEESNIWNKIITHIPQDSVIGRLLDHKEKCIVVYSIEKGIYQHDIYSWQVMRNSVITLEEVTDSSEVINQALTEWLENTKPEQRKIFFDQIFDILYAADVTSTIEIRATLIKKIPELIRAYKEVSDDEKGIIAEMVRIFIRSYIQKIRENEGKKINRFQNNFEQRRAINEAGNNTDAVI